DLHLARAPPRPRSSTRPLATTTTAVWLVGSQKRGFPPLSLSLCIVARVSVFGVSLSLSPRITLRHQFYLVLLSWNTIKPSPRLTTTPPPSNRTRRVSRSSSRPRT